MRFNTRKWVKPEYEIKPQTLPPRDPSSSTDTDQNNSNTPSNYYPGSNNPGRGGATVDLPSEAPPPPDDRHPRGTKPSPKKPDPPEEIEIPDEVPEIEEIPQTDEINPETFDPPDDQCFLNSLPPAIAR